MQGARIRRSSIVCTFLLGLALVAVPASAQTGQTKGKVVDAKNQPVEGATVTIEATDGMGRKYTVKTNRRGEFVQIGLQPGQYKLTAEKDGLSESHERRIQQLALFLCYRAKVLMQIVGPIAVGGDLSMQDERGDGISDGVVEQAVKRAEFAQGDGRIHLDRQLGDDLADVTVPMDYLTYGVALLEQLFAV